MSIKRTITIASGRHFAHIKLFVRVFSHKRVNLQIMEMCIMETVNAVSPWSPIFLSMYSIIILFIFVENLK